MDFDNDIGNYNDIFSSNRVEEEPNKPSIRFLVVAFVFLHAVSTLN